MHADAHDPPAASNESYREDNRSKRSSRVPSPRTAWKPSSSSFVFWDQHPGVGSLVLLAGSERPRMRLLRASVDALGFTGRHHASKYRSGRKDHMTNNPGGCEDLRSGGEEQETSSGSYRAGARAAIPFALAVFVVGISFGVLARSLGWGIIAPIVISVIAFSGSAQFAVAAVLGAGGSVIAAILAAVLLNARFGPMGVAVAPYLKGGPLRRALEGQAVVDASWALASRGGGRFDRDFIGDPEKLGLDVIFPAFFLALLAEELREARAIVVALIAAVLALSLVPFVSPGVPVIAACAAAMLGLRRSS